MQYFPKYHKILHPYYNVLEHKKVICTCKYKVCAMHVQVLIYYEYFIIIKVVLGMLRVHWNMVGGFCDILGSIAFESILVYFRSTFAYIELTLEYLGSTLKYVESNWGILGVL